MRSNKQNFNYPCFILLIFYVIASFGIALYVNFNMPSSIYFRLLDFDPEKIDISTTLFYLMAMIFIGIGTLRLLPMQKIKNAMADIPLSNYTWLPFVAVYLLLVGYLQFYPWNHYEIGYALAVVFVLFFKYECKNKSIYLKITFVIANALLIIFLSDNLWAIFLVLICMIPFVPKKRLMVSMVLCASAIILFAFQVYKVNIRSEHYFDTGYTNNQVKMLLKDKNEKNIDEERKIAYINSKYNATFNEEAATAEKEKIINEISAVELEHLMPDNYSIRYIITYLYLKNFILLVGFLIITMGLTVQLYKHCFRVGITEHYLLFVAVSTISLKQVCYILSNFGYSSGANMNLWLITNNPVMRMIDILALAIIGGYLIKGIFQNTKHNKN